MERQAVGKNNKVPSGNDHPHRQPARSSSAGHPLLELQRSIGEGCTAVLEGIRDQFLPGGQVVDEPTGFPPREVLIPKSAEALLRRLDRRLRK